MVNVHEVHFEYERQKQVYVFGTLFYLSFFCMPKNFIDIRAWTPY